MTVRPSVAASLLLALLLLRAGSLPAMAECLPGHHTGGAPSGVAVVIHGGHDAGHPSPDPATDCGHESQGGQSPSSADCGLMAGCASTSLEMARSMDLARAEEVEGVVTTLILRGHPRSTRPASPPPKS